MSCVNALPYDVLPTAVRLNFKVVIKVDVRDFKVDVHISTSKNLFINLHPPMLGTITVSAPITAGRMIIHDLA